jgi:hypothetical protein
MGREGTEAYARAREGEDEPDRGWAAAVWQSEALGEEVRQGGEGTFRRSLRLMRRTANREGWRHLSAYRSANLSRALRAIERVLGEKYAGRAKENGRWRVRARAGDEVVLVVEVALARLRKKADFTKPLEVVVFRPDVLDVPALERELKLRPRHRATAPVLDTKLPIASQSTTHGQ